ncbi:MAG: hypothetical protein JXB85_10185 [Anaerolineales bacterium]|nr:hypothetical protein [Anaerolineales bacterium]
MVALESPESSSPIVTRAVAAGLQGRFIDNYRIPGWQKAILFGLGALPQEVARFAISRFQSLSGLPPEALDGFHINRLIDERLADYAQLSGPFPCLTIGAALGGATTYLSLALGGPFLPQTFVLSLKGGSPDGDVRVYLERSRRRALQIAAENPGLMTIQHYDPVHDGWLTRHVNHLRFKLLDLPPAYAAILYQHLEPSGTVVYLEGGAEWLRYRLGERSVFQVGGWGGITPEEFLEPGEQIRRSARQAGLKYSDWRLPDLPLERGPESEWGSEPGLGEALEAFCRSEGFRFVRIRLPHPDDFSRLAFAAAGKLLEKEGRPPAGVLVEMFSQFDASAAMQAGLLPLWLIFNTYDSLAYLQSMRARFPPAKPVFFSPLATFSQTPDLVPWESWVQALAGCTWINTGTRPSHYPSDARALVKWAAPLREWVTAHRNPITARLSAEELADLAQVRKE